MKRGPREYEFESTVDEMPVLVIVEVSGSDVGSRGYDPPEYREANVSVWMLDGRTDITDDPRVEPLLNDFVDEGLSMDDDAMEAAYDDAMERRGDERREGV